MLNPYLKSKTIIPDTSIILAARKNNALILTDDFPLNGMCKKIGINSIHIYEILSQKEIFEKKRFILCDSPPN
jgi:hypothetical protein